MASTIIHERLAMRQLLWIGPLAMLLAALANLIIHAIGVSFFGVSGAFPYFQAPTIIGSTIFYLLLALIAFILVNRFSQHPIRTYRILVLVALLVSFLIPIMALSGHAGISGMTLSIFWSMIAMHIVSAIITVSLFTTLTRA